MADRSLPRAVQLVLQIIAFGAFASVLAYFSTHPSYRLRADDSALVKLSFSHAAQLVQACRERTPEELAKLAPNMRTKMDCPRQRANVVALTAAGVQDDGVRPAANHRHQRLDQRRVVPGRKEPPPRLQHGSAVPAVGGGVATRDEVHVPLARLVKRVA